MVDLRNNPIRVENSGSSRAFKEGNKIGKGYVVWKGTEYTAGIIMIHVAQETFLYSVNQQRTEITDL